MLSNQPLLLKIALLCPKFEKTHFFTLLSVICYIALSVICKVVLWMGSFVITMKYAYPFMAQSYKGRCGWPLIIAGIFGQRDHRLLFFVILLCGMSQSGEDNGLFGHV